MLARPGNSTRLTSHHSERKALFSPFYGLETEAQRGEETRPRSRISEVRGIRAALTAPAAPAGSG